MEKALVLALSAFGACLGIGLAALGAAIGDGHAASKMLEGTARQPEMGGKLLVNMLISIGLIESMPIIAAVISIVLVFANPFVSQQPVQARRPRFEIGQDVPEALAIVLVEQRVGIDEDIAGAFLCGVHDLRKAQPAAKLLLQLVDQPHAHDVLLIAVIAHAALVGVIGGTAGSICNGLRRFDAQERPCAGRNIGRVFHHGDTLHR